MIRSMTGYGEAELDTPAGRLRAEARTVNHRYFSLNLRLGRGLDRYEPQIREWLRAAAAARARQLLAAARAAGRRRGDEAVALRSTRRRRSSTCAAAR
jgi:uncharacterized protein YicC (UPF0701 family)